MTKLLYVQASPRQDRSRSIQVADAFVDAYVAAHVDDEVQTLSLFEADLPAFDGLAVQAKYTILNGQMHPAAESEAWRAVEKVVVQFKSAQKYVLAVPMWNFSIPYRLKHYIDLLVQPGYTFSYDPQTQYAGMLKDRRVFVVYARGGDYTDPHPPPFEFQKSYLAAILGFIGLTDMQSVTIEPTVVGSPELIGERLAAAIAEAQDIAKTF